MEKTNIPLERNLRIWIRMPPNKHRWPIGTEKHLKFLLLRLSKTDNINVGGNVGKVTLSFIIDETA